MTMIAMAFPILPGKTEAWKEWVGELNRSPRKAEFDDSRQRYGVRERTYFQPTPHGDLVIVTLEGEDPGRALAAWPQEDNEFARWFVDKVIELHGVDLRQPPPGPLPELITQSPPVDESERNAAIVASAFEAFARQDIPAVLAGFDPDIDWYAPDELPIGGTYRGHEGVLQFFGGLPTYFDELHVEPLRIVGSGNTVVSIGHHHGRVNGRPFDVGFSMEWTMRDGKAIRFREYNDSGKLLQTAAGETSNAENKDIVRRFLEGLVAQDFDALAAILAPDYVNHFPGAPQPIGRDGMEDAGRAMLTAFPDLRVEIHEMIAEGDMVATRYTMHGTHRGPFLDVPATGRPISIPGTAVHRLRDGKITTDYPGFDLLSILQQLGVAPQPARA